MTPRDAYDRFREASKAGAPNDQLAAHWEQACVDNQRSLDLLPHDHHKFCSNAHIRLGGVYSEIGDISTAISHYQQAIRHYEVRGDTYWAGTTRFNIAIVLGSHDRVGDALLYARAALVNYQQIGPSASANAAQTEQLIQYLERLATTQPS